MCWRTFSNCCGYIKAGSFSYLNTKNNVFCKYFASWFFLLHLAAFKRWGGSSLRKCYVKWIICNMIINLSVRMSTSDRNIKTNLCLLIYNKIFSEQQTRPSWKSIPGSQKLYNLKLRQEILGVVELQKKKMNELKFNILNLFWETSSSLYLYLITVLFLKRTWHHS